MAARRRFASFLLALSASLSVFQLASMPAGAAGGVTLDGSLNPAKTGPVGPGMAGGSAATYLITESMGARSGANLFHSFGTFNIATGESAAFTGSAGVANIISRVTGGAPSNIDGLIRSTISGADLFLINPNGVVFGPNASLDLGGSFHVSTADYLSLQGGGIYYSDPAASSVLSVAAPEAFGFLGPAPAAITGNSAYLQVLDGETISLIAGGISYTAIPESPDYILYMPSALAAPGGRINLVAVASAGEVSLTDPEMGTASFSALGPINFSEGAKLGVVVGDGSSAPGGTVFIRGGEMVFRDGGIDAVGDPAGSVDMKGASLNLDNFYVYAAGFGAADHPGAACTIDVSGAFSMTHAALIDTSVYSAGRGGSIGISAGEVTLGDGVIDGASYSSIGYYGYIGSVTSGAGRSGDVTITSGGDLTMRNGFFASTQAYADGDAGDVTVHAAGTMYMKDMGSVSTDASYLGNGGDIDIQAADIVISATDQANVTNISAITGFAAHVDYYSNGGRMTVEADTIRILDGGRISTVLYGEGSGADVVVNANEILVSGFIADYGGDPPYFLSSIDGRVYGEWATGTGGDITVNTGKLTLTNGGAVRTGLYGDAPGNAGNITINADTIDINGLGQIYADSFRGTGNSGGITINALSMDITGTAGADPPVPLDFDFTGISNSTRDGSGGTITAVLTGGLTLTEGGGIKADTQGSGAGGAIDISARDMTLAGGSSINCSSTGTGDAGGISLAAASSIVLNGSSVTTEAMLADGGNITITAPYMVSLTDSQVTASVGGGELTTGGNIDIDPQFVILKDSSIVANAYEGTGGHITIVADTFLSDPASAVDASSALGVSGVVDIQAPINNVSGLLNPLSAEFVSASALLRERCIARIRGGKYNSFIVGGRDGVPIEPGNLIPGMVR